MAFPLTSVTVIVSVLMLLDVESSSRTFELVVLFASDDVIASMVDFFGGEDCFFSMTVSI